MTDLPIRLFPDPALRKNSTRVTEFGSPLQNITQKLEAVMRSQPSGIGIAAPQVGILLKVAIVDLSARLPQAKRLILINPQIIKASDKRFSREGCMSLPEYTAQITRFDQIHLRWQDLAGGQKSGIFVGLEAVCIQHEVDHLEGLLIIDRVVSLKRDLIPRPVKHYKG